MILSQVCLADGPYDKFPEKAPEVGKTAPDFTLKTLDGETFKLSAAYAKGPVVIEFGSFT
jgi:peroxiredoxin